MMKRRNFMAVLLAAVLAITACACGTDAKDTQKEDTQKEDTQKESQGSFSGSGETGKGDSAASGKDSGKEDSESTAGSTEIVLKKNQKKYANESGFVIITFGPDGEYWKCEQYDAAGKFLWQNPSEAVDLQGEARNVEVCTGEDAEGHRVYRTFYATHQLFDALIDYEGAMDWTEYPYYMNFKEDSITYYNLERYHHPDYYYKIKEETYTLVK